MTDRRCKDCLAEGVTTNRPAPFAGPRCKTHDRAVRKARGVRAHGNRLEAVYGITRGQYEALYEAQGGVCAICRRATGATRRLSVDHDHALAAEHDHDVKSGCPTCIRGLCCRPCNDLLGHARDDINFFARAIAYLANPPAKGVLE